MLDAYAREALARPLDALALPLAGRGVRPDQITLAGFAIGLAAIPLLAAGQWLLGLAAILLNRLADGLDGALARRVGTSDGGAYLDIVCDFVVYSGVAFGFALARPENAVAGAFLIFAFVGTGSTFLAYAIFAAKRGMADAAPLPMRRSFHYLGGLTEGTETLIAFVAFCLFPGSFPVLAWIFGGLCWLTTATRILAALQAFRR